MIKETLEINMYRYNPEQDKFPYIKNYIINKHTIEYNTWPTITTTTTNSKPISQ